MRKASPRTILVALCGLVAIGFAIHWLFSPSAASRKPGWGDIPPVTVAAAERRNVPVDVEAVGTVLANATVQVKSRIDGEIVAVAFKEGQIVRKGDLLFQIDRAPYEAALRAAKANLQRDEAQLDNARLDLGRANKLLAKGYASQQTHDAAQAQVKALEGSVAADRAAIDQAALQLGYTEIRSPIDGKTGPYLVDAGNIVKAADANPLVVVTQIQPVKISFALAQQHLAKLQSRMAEKALVASFRPHNSSREISAPIDFIGNQVNADAGTIELRATYDNAGLDLVPGEFVNVRVHLDEITNAVVVPREAVNTGQDRLYVYVVTADSKAEARNVDVLHRSDDMAALAPGAVKPGEQVVTDGQMRVAPGMPVKIVPRGPGA